MQQMGSYGMQPARMHPDQVLQMLMPIVQEAAKTFDAGVTMHSALKEAVLAAFLAGRGMSPEDAQMMVNRWRGTGLSRELLRSMRTEPLRTEAPRVMGEQPMAPRPQNAQRPAVTPARVLPELMLTQDQREELLTRLQAYMQDQVTAAAFYQELMDQATDPMAKDYIDHAREDEQKHYEMLNDLYKELTGQSYEVQPQKVEYASLREGLVLAMNDEYEAMEEYRDSYLQYTSERLRRLFFELMTDELEHATRFNYVLQTLPA